ncbi:MAG: hypothetical protein WBM99_07150 [Psychromonas sp.]
MPSSLAVAALTLLPMSIQSSDDWIINSSLYSLSYVENNSIYDFVKGKESDYKSGENAFTFNEFSLGAQYNNFSFSLFSRYEWFLDYSEDTMEFYGTTVNGTLIEADRKYNLDLDVQHINTEGFRLAYMHQLNEINLYFAASYLKARELLVGGANGQASLKESCGDGFECYTGDLDLSYTYSEDIIFDRNVDAPKSLYGYSFDIGGDWIINDSWFGSIYIQDLFSEILWDKSPFTDASATTATTTIDDGKYKIDPVITGYEGNENYKQTLPIKYNVLLSYQFTPQHSTYIRGFHSYGATLFHLGYRFQHLGSLYGLKLYPLEGAVGVEFKNKYIDISIASESFDYQDAELFEFKFAVTVPL